MRKWFENVTTIEELRKRYRELLKMYHPDNENGSVEITQEINTEYTQLQWESDWWLLCNSLHKENKHFYNGQRKLSPFMKNAV